MERESVLVYTAREPGQGRLLEQESEGIRQGGITSLWISGMVIRS